MNSFEKLQLKVILEKLIVGLEEPILIKSVGKMIAKIDSGNGGYNVIHGENLYYQGDVLTFETSDINGNRKVVSKKVKDTIKINIGGGNIQERPVIELNIKFAGEDYKKIPFSVTDRSTNDQKVLISKDFLVNQLDALIDPSTKDIADKNIDVDYPINENFFDGDNSTRHFDKNKVYKNSEIIRGAKAVGRGAKAVGRGAKAAWNYGKKDIKDVGKDIKNASLKGAKAAVKGGWNGGKAIVKGGWNAGKGGLKIATGLLKAGIKMAPGLFKKTHNFIKKWGELSRVDTSHMYQYQDTFIGLKDMLKDVFSFGKDEIHILNQFGVPEKVKDKLSQFDNYVKKYDKTRTSIKALADDFTYDFGEDKADKKKNESFYLFRDALDRIKLFENAADEPSPQPTNDSETKPSATDGEPKPPATDNSEVNTNNLDELKIAVKAKIENTIAKELQQLEKLSSYIKKSAEDVKEKIEIAEKKIEYYQIEKKVLEEQLNYIKNDTSEEFKDSKDNLIKSYNEDLKANEGNIRKANDELKALKMSLKLKDRGKLSIYFKLVNHDRKNKKIDPFNYANQYIYNVLNKRPQIFDEFIKGFYGNTEKDKKWETSELVNLLEKPKEKFKNVIAENNEKYFNSDEKDKNIAIYGDLCLKTPSGEQVLITIARDTRSTGEDIEDNETEEEFFIRISKNYNEDNDSNILSDARIKDRIFIGKLKEKTLINLLHTSGLSCSDFDKNKSDIIEKLNNGYNNLIELK